MSRSHFLSLSLLASIGSSLPLSALSSPAPRNLRAWANAHAATIQTSGEFLLLNAKVPVQKLSDSLASLAHLCDGPMHAKGNQLRGVCDGQAFQLSLN